MTNKITYITMVLLSAAISCTEQTTLPALRASLSVGSVSSKTGLNGNLQTVWHSNEPVSVFYNGDVQTLWTFEGTSGSTSGNIGIYGTFPSLTHATALIPYDESATLSGGTVSTTIPSSFKYDGFSTSFAVLIADSSSQPLIFKYASAVVSLELTAETAFELDEIKLQGGCSEVLCGSASSSASDPSLTVSGDGKALSLQIPQEYSSLSGKSVFNFGIPPGTYPSGISFVIKMKDGASFNVISSTSFTIAAGELKTVSCRLCSQEAAMFDLDFTTGTCPFRYKNTGSPVSGLQATSDSGEVFVATGTDLKEYDFVVFSQNEGYYYYSKSSTCYFRLSTGSGSTGSGPCWMKLPKVENKVLSSIGLKLSNTSAGTKGFYICDNSDGDDPLATIEVVIKEGSLPDEVLTYIPLSPTGDYYIYGKGNAKNAQITRLVLNYE